MNNKPVAWVDKTDIEDGFFYPTILTKMETISNNIPLYTHPVKELKNIVLASATCSCGKVMEVTNLQPVKELTDEKIWEVIDNYFGVHAFNLDYQISLDEAREDAFELVKAVLRKAQEK